MKTNLIIVTLVLVVVAALGLTGFAYAQRPDPSTPYGGYGMMGGYGHMGGFGMMGGSYGPMHTYMLEAFSEAVGLSVDDLENRIQAGESMWDIAASQGYSQEEITGLMEQAHDKALETAVADGALTAEQADWMDERMEQMYSGEYGFGGCHGNGAGGFQGRGPGMRWNTQPGTSS